jgi:hypothetical protein
LGVHFLRSPQGIL